jgi:hypothetical protein
VGKTFYTSAGEIIKYKTNILGQYTGFVHNILVIKELYKAS